MRKQLDSQTALGLLQFVADCCVQLIVFLESRQYKFFVVSIDGFCYQDHFKKLGCYAPRRNNNNNSHDNVRTTASAP